MSLNTHSTTNGFKQLFAGRALQLAFRALQALVVSAGFASAQTPFTIQSVSSGLVLDVPDFSKSAGTLIQQYPANGGTNQQWMLHRNTGNSARAYEIISVSSGLVLDVPASSTRPGTQIQQFPSNGGANQLWSLAPVASNSLAIVSVESGAYYTHRLNELPGIVRQPGTRCSGLLNHGPHRDPAIYGKLRNQSAVALQATRSREHFPD